MMAEGIDKRALQADNDLAGGTSVVAQCAARAALHRRGPVACQDDSGRAAAHPAASAGTALSAGAAAGGDAAAAAGGDAAAAAGGAAGGAGGCRAAHSACATGAGIGAAGR